MATTFISIKCLNCTCMSGPFQKLSKQELETVDNHRTELSYKKGQTMCKQGSFISNMMFVRKGLAKIYLEGPQNSVMISLVGVGSFIGLPSLFDQGIYHYTVEAVEDTEVCLVDINVFRQLINKNAAFATSVLQMVNQILINSYNRLYGVASKQINGRFAEMLLHLKRNVFAAEPHGITISNKDLAELVYTSQESISRLIKDFKQDGLISHDGQGIRLLDETRLEKISRVG